MRRWQGLGGSTGLHGVKYQIELHQRKEGFYANVNYRSARPFHGFLLAGGAPVVKLFHICKERVDKRIISDIIGP